MPFRYEIESDENRQITAIEIGRKYLDVDEEIKAIDQDSEKMESNNINNVSSSPNKNNQITPNNESEKVDGGGDGDVNLVVDILNDELIAQVRQKIHSKMKMKIFLLFFIAER